MHAARAPAGAPAPRCRTAPSRPRCSDAPARQARSGTPRTAAAARRTAGPQRRQHRPAQRDHVEQRQEDEMHVVLAQPFLARAHLGTPKRVGVGPDDALGSRRGARGEQHRDRVRGIDSGGQGRVADQVANGAARPRSAHGRLCARIARRDDDPALARHAFDPFAQVRLGDDADRARALEKIGELGRRRGRVDRHADRAAPCAGEPHLQRLRAVLEQQDDAVAATHRARGEPAGDARHVVCERAVRPGLRLALERAQVRNGRSGVARARASSSAQTLDASTGSSGFMRRG